MKRKSWLVTILLLLAVPLAVSCAEQNTSISKEEEVPPEEQAEPDIKEGPRWFPDSVRWLTDEEKNKLVEIALNTPAALEWQQKETQYNSEISWIALYPDPSGGGYSAYQKYEYEIVETGIPTYTTGRTVRDPKDADIYPNVTIWFGEPCKWILSVAVDLEAEIVILEEDYPNRTPPTPPEDEE